MNSAFLRRATDAALIATAVVICLVLTVQTFSNPDVWWHLALGRRILSGGIPAQEPFAFTAAAHTWVDQQWLYEVLLAKTVSITPVLAALGTGAVATLAFVLAVRSVPRHVTVPVVWSAIALLLVVDGAHELLGVDAAVFTVAGTAAMMWIITRWRDGDNRPLWLAPAVMLLWVNLHAGFVAGLAVLLLAALLPLPRRDIAVERRPLLLALLGTVIATLVNPAGPGVIAYVIDAATNAGLGSSPNFHETSTRVFELAAMTLVAAWVLSPERPDTADVIFGVVALSAALLTAGNVPLFGVVAAPQIARYGSAAWRAHSRRLWSGRLPGQRLIAASAVLLMIVSSAAAVRASSQHLHGLSDGGYEASTEPHGASAYVMALHPGERVYATLPTADYLVYRLPAGRLVMLYGEPAVFGSSGMRRYLDIDALHANWAERIQEIGVHVAILPTGAREVSALLGTGWSISCRDRSAPYVVMAAPAEVTSAISTDPTTAPYC